ncbi:MAG: type II secretion system protein [Acidobacteria bacterium]|nr:type II secretion system protein [Acidobacteriota bacterium]
MERRTRSGRTSFSLFLARQARACPTGASSSLAPLRFHTAATLAPCGAAPLSRGALWARPPGRRPQAPSEPTRGSARRPGGLPHESHAALSSSLSSRGFTLIEMMIVMTIVTILVSMAVPLYQRSVLRAKESVLRQNLFTLRTVIDEYTYDKQKAPQTLEDLVTEGYLRQVPVDPITTSNRTWKIIMEDALTSVNQTEPGIFDVRSGSDKVSPDGTGYSEW